MTLLNLISFVSLLIIFLLIYFISQVLIIYFKEKKERKISKIYYLEYCDIQRFGIIDIVANYNGILNSWDIDKISIKNSNKDIWEKMSDDEKISINIFLNLYFNNIRRDNSLNY